MRSHQLPPDREARQRTLTASPVPPHPQGEFDAGQYGFFGEMLLPNEELGGALEVRTRMQQRLRQWRRSSAASRPLGP